MDNLRQDLRSAIRMMLRRPGFALVTIVTLALGIGANTAIFSVVYGVLLRPLPINDPDRVVRLYETYPRGWGTVSAANLKDWQERNGVFQNLSGYLLQSFNIEGEEAPIRVPGAAVSANYFDTMGMRPELGRGFVAGEDAAGNDHVAVIGDKTWRSQYGGHANVIGQSIKLGGDSYTVVGVAPEDFPFPSQATQIWVPLVFPKDYLTLRGSHMYSVVGRLSSGVTVDQAMSQMKTIASQIEGENPKEQTGRSLMMTPLKDDLVTTVRPALLVVFGAVAAVLLICCVNVASLMLTSAAARRRETVIRAALGAGRGRVVRQFLTESLLLSLIGGTAGALLARPALAALLALASTFLPRAQEVALDWRVLAFTLALSVFTGVAFGTVPALVASRTDLRDALSEGSRTSAGGASLRLRQGLVVAEIALSLALLIGAGLMVKSLVRLRQVNTGIQADNVITMQFSLPEVRYKTSDSKIDFFKQTLAKIEAVPGVDSAAVVNLLPLQETGFNGNFGIEGRAPDAPGSEPIGEWRSVSPDYFRAMGIPLLEGRAFGDQDNAKSPDVIVINHALAERYFPGEDPIGKNIVLGQARLPIIGVVGDVRESALSKPVMPSMFLSCNQSPLADGSGAMSLVVRGRMNTDQLIPAVREQIRAVDRSQPIYNVKSMERVISESTSDSRLNAVLLSAFAILALMLGAIGIYGVISSYYQQRTREIGVRMALGALPSRIELMAIRQGAILALIGIALGLGLAFALTRTLATLLYSVSPMDASAYAIMAGVLLIVALLACYIPARRASRVDPLSALRYE